MLLTSKLSQVCIDQHKLNIPEELKLSDPLFYIASDIDILILIYILISCFKEKSSYFTEYLSRLGGNWKSSYNSDNVSLFVQSSDGHSPHNAVGKIWKLEVSSNN